MLATTWSKPSATNAMIGKKMARILPATSSAASAIHTPRQTSQLQPDRAGEDLPLRLSTPFVWAMLAAPLERSGPVTTPV